jgi:hypothetical protein
MDFMGAFDRGATFMVDYNVVSLQRSPLVIYIF